MNETSTERLYRVAVSGKEIGEYSPTDLQAYWDGGHLDREAVYLHPSGQWRPVRSVVRDVTQQRAANRGPVPVTESDRKRWVYVLLGLLVGWFGVHNFYARRTGVATFQLIYTALLGWTGFLLIPLGFWLLAEVILVRRDGLDARLS